MSTSPPAQPHLTGADLIAAVFRLPTPLLVLAVLVLCGGVAWLFWRQLDPDRNRYGLRSKPVLTDVGANPRGGGGVRRHHRRPTAMTNVEGFPLDLPPDYIPKDPVGRTPWDLLGPDLIRGAVDQLYSMLLSDPHLRDHFTGVDMVRLKRHQALFIGQVLGGPTTFTLDQIRSAHLRLHLSPEAHWAVVAHLMVVLTRNGVPDWINKFVLMRLYEIRNHVIHPDYHGKPVPVG